MSTTTVPRSLDLSRDDLPGLAVAVLLCEAVGASPAFVTRTGLSTWYVALNRPAFTPPNWVFGPVWTFLFFLLGVAVYLVWRDGRGTRAGRIALGAFVGQFALNVAWTLAFFGQQSIGGGLVVIAALWLAIAATVVAFARVHRGAALLLVPYLLWVSFAGVLNAAIWTLN
ncbi:TspO/MBR family protein [Halobacteriaceae archaeon GCM10025711]